VAAVRGPLTRARLQAVEVSCPEVYGDPALLFPQFYNPQIEPTFELGIIPHYIDANLPFLTNLSEREEVSIIDITQAGRAEKIYSFINDVLSCRRIVSSSLHGLIIAEAYGIPAVWAEFSDKVFGSGFKFLDYQISVGRNPDRIQKIGIFTDPQEAIHEVEKLRAAIGPINFDYETLLKAFPYDRICAKGQ
jgi:pyruvyltransferase